MKIILLFLVLHFFFLGVCAQNIMESGGLIRLNPSKKEVMLLFTASETNDGTKQILQVLSRHRIKASFFFTGRFLSLYPNDIQQIMGSGHYVGSHGYEHLLYCAWENRDSLLISRKEFCNDIHKSFQELARLGVDTMKARYFMPPYEYYNDSISFWAQDIGVHLVNYTPGSTTNADYTIPSMKNYRSSKQIYNNVLALEQREGLNGYLLLFHLGTSAKRKDKFYRTYLHRLIRNLKRKGYTFRSDF